ncbi:cerebratulus toxin A-III-like isoform X2 [Lineus longissimus]|uniref:cerebratulus toxin A-III-like isoform X2 n=1 Tax=Lineus longissimus TaxID=88925 RepID=UPI002B4F5CEE
MNRAQLISVCLLGLITGEMVNGLDWPTYPGKEGIRSSKCQKTLNCGTKNIATKLVCKGFCLGRKRFWEKCGKNGSKSKSKICNALIAQACERAGKGLISLTDKAVTQIVSLATGLIGGKRDMSTEELEYFNELKRRGIDFERRQE